MLGMPPICAPEAASLGAAHGGSQPLISAFGNSGGGAAALTAISGGKGRPTAGGFGGSNSGSPVCPAGRQPGGMAPPQLPPPEHFPPALQALAEQQRLFMERKYQEQVR